MQIRKEVTNYSVTKECQRCETYTTASGGTGYASSSYCRSSVTVTMDKCYLPNGTSAQDTTGYFSITGGNCFYKS